MGTHDTLLLISGPLPPICLKCVTSAGVHAERHHFATVGESGALGDVADVTALLSDGAGAALGTLGFVRLVLATREAELDVPLCPACAARWRRARQGHHASVALSVALIVACVVALAAGPRLAGTTLYVVVAAFVLLVMVAIRGIPALVSRLVLEPASLRALRIDERGVVLAGVANGWPDAARRWAP